jgi:hypothetical protein
MLTILGRAYQPANSFKAFAAPAAFLSAWDYRSLFTIQEKGRKYQSTFNTAPYAAPAGTTVYLNPFTGNNSNSGLTEALPKASLSGASGALSVANVSVIICAPGYYAIGDVMNVTNRVVLTRDLAIICPTGRAYFTISNGFSTYSWAVESAPNGNVYREAGYSAVQIVIDVTNLDSSGDPIPLLERASIAECQANPNSWFHDGSNLYVHTFDSRAPANGVRDIVGLRGAGAIKNLDVEGNFKLYLKNITLWGGNQPLLYETTNGTAAQIVAENCDFLYGGAGSGVSMDDLSFAYFKNCRARYNKLDGFSFNGTVTSGNHVCDNCTSTDNGLASVFGTTGDDYDLNCNAFTSHNNCNLVLLSCTGDRTDGPLCAIVNTVDALVLGCTMGQSLIETGTAVSFNVTAGTTMHMKNCQSGASFYGRQNISGTFIDYGGYINGSTNGDNGTITAG